MSAPDPVRVRIIGPHLVPEVGGRGSARGPATSRRIVAHARSSGAHLRVRG
jgi:hypothetical protein